MNKVVTINLNGHAYQVDDEAFELLRAYLDRAGVELRDNPDRVEIIADLEQAIAEKCQRFLGPQKSVVAAEDVRQALKEMGPVDAGAGAAEPSGATAPPRAEAAASAPAPKRLYRIMDGAWLGGVCTGIAAFVNADPTVIRAVWGVLGLLDASVLKVPIFTLVYLALWSLIPEASTSEQRAAASGTAFNAREVVAEAKRHYAEFRSGRERSHWRQRRREFRRRLHQRGFGVPPWSPLAASPLAQGARATAGAFAPALTFTAVLLFWIMAFVALSLADTRTIYDWTLPPDVPLWAALLGVVLVYHWTVLPLRLARRASRYALTGGRPGWIEAWDNLTGIAFSALILWFAYTNVPDVRDLVHRLPDLWYRLTEWTIEVSTTRSR